MVKKDNATKRTKIGIAGLDSILKGGLPEGGIYVLVGGCGTGKTVFGMQFIHSGATLYNEPGIFVNLEEEKSKMLHHAKSLGWDFEQLEKKGSVRVVPFLESIIGDVDSSLSSKVDEAPAITKRIQYLSTSTLSVLIKEAMMEIKAKRLVIDPWTAVTLLAESEGLARMGSMVFFKELKELGITTLITIEKETGYWEQIKFLADGVIELDYVHTDEKSYRGLCVRKVRGSSFTEGHFNFSIGPKGIKTQTEGL